MNPQDDSIVMIQNEIGQWEHAINSYAGQDPLDLWFSYICWLESNLPSHQGLESKFRKSVEHCLSMYDKFESYKQDLRMVKLWIKYIDFQPNPLNLYKILYQQGVGTKCAAFYIGWAHYFNSANHFKQAESIYNLGIQLKAEPLHELETAQKNFRFSVAQRMLYNDESSKKRTISSLEEQRQQITSLSPHQNQISAKRMRTDSYSQEQYNNGQTPNMHNNLQQYPDYNNYSNDAGYAISSSLNYVYDNSNVYPPTVDEQPQQQNQQTTQQSSNYTFECGFQMPQNFINFSRNSHETWNAQLFLEEPYDPNKRCFYQKHLVYPGNGTEYSLEELKGHKWRLRMEEKRRQEELRVQRETEEKIRQEQERARLEQERIRQDRIKQEQEMARQEQERVRHEQERARQEQERIRQEAETRRLREEQIMKEQEAQRIKAEQEAQRQREAYQIQQQQRWNYHHSPANYATPYYHQNYQNSPQYSYAHDHQYQTHFHAAYQHSPQSYSNSPNYHQQSVMHQQYYMNYQAQHTMSYQMQPPPQHHHQPVHPVHAYSQPTPPQSQSTPPIVNIQQQPTQIAQKQNYQDNSDYQDVEYLIDHQAEIDPKMLQQPIVENSSQENSSQENSSSPEDEEYEESESDEYEEEEEQIPTIVTSYMLDDLEEQIEASTISFSSNGKSRDKKITIKFRKEKTTTIINSESNSNSSITHPKAKEVPLEPSSTSSSKSSTKKKAHKEVVTSYDGENTQFMPSATNSCSSVQNGDNLKHSFSKITFNGCITPIKKPPASKTSTPISSYKFLKNQSSFRSINDDSRSSFCGDQNSFFQADNDEDFKCRRMEKALATIEEHKKKRDIDPFNSELCRAFLVKLNFPNRENTSDYLVTNTNLPKLIKNQTVPISDAAYQIEKEVGRGSYGAVYRGINTSDGTAVALKYQRPSNLATWELYICTEVKKRIRNADILSGFMTITAAVIAPNASVLISEFSQYGSLLDINNRIRQATTKVMHESLVMHFTSQIFNIVAHLHDCKIIHADIKPDNFLLMTLPSMDTHIPSLRLIDFGCAIDMTLFKEGQEFRKIIETDGFTCVEMREGRLWSYQTDLFCIAGTIHVMLFGEYMQVNKKFGVWDIKQKFPRYLNKILWTDVFSKLLNVKDSNTLPNLRQMKASVDREINENELGKNIRTVSNLIRKR